MCHVSHVLFALLGHGNTWEQWFWGAWETQWEHGNTNLVATRGRLGNPMGTWELGTCTFSEATWEHQLGIKTTSTVAALVTPKKPILSLATQHAEQECPGMSTLF